MESLDETMREALVAQALAAEGGDSGPPSGVRNHHRPGSSDMEWDMLTGDAARGRPASSAPARRASAGLAELHDTGDLSTRSGGSAAAAIPHADTTAGAAAADHRPAASVRAVLPGLVRLADDDAAPGTVSASLILLSGAASLMEAAATRAEEVEAGVSGEDGGSSPQGIASGGLFGPLSTGGDSLFGGPAIPVQLGRVARVGASGPLHAAASALRSAASRANGGRATWAETIATLDAALERLNAQVRGVTATVHSAGIDGASGEGLSIRAAGPAEATNGDAFRRSGCPGLAPLLCIGVVARRGDGGAVLTLPQLLGGTLGWAAVTAVPGETIAGLAVRVLRACGAGFLASPVAHRPAMPGSGHPAINSSSLGHRSSASGEAVPASLYVPVGAPDDSILPAFVAPDAWPSFGVGADADGSPPARVLGPSSAVPDRLVAGTRCVRLRPMDQSALPGTAVPCCAVLVVDITSQPTLPGERASRTPRTASYPDPVVRKAPSPRMAPAAMTAPPISAGVMMQIGHGGPPATVSRGVPAGAWPDHVPALAPTPMTSLSSSAPAWIPAPMAAHGMPGAYDGLAPPLGHGAMPPMVMPGQSAPGMVSMPPGIAPLPGALPVMQMAMPGPALTRAECRRLDTVGLVRHVHALCADPSLPAETSGLRDALREFQDRTHTRNADSLAAMMDAGFPDVAAMALRVAMDRDPLSLTYALQTVTNLGMHEVMRARLGDTGCIEAIAGCLRHDAGHQQRAVKDGIVALRHLAYENDENKIRIIESGAMGLAVHCMGRFRDAPQVQKQACNALKIFAVHTRRGDDVKRAVLTAGGVDALLSCLFMYRGDTQVASAALGALSTLFHLREARAHATRLGAPHLIQDISAMAYRAGNRQLQEACRQAGSKLVA